MWYYKCGGHANDGGGGTVSWTARPDAFPDSMEGLYYNTSLPVIAHNRWWCSNTTYAKENGGDYDFSIDRNTGFALPTEYQFWDDLFRNSTRWGLRYDDFVAKDKFKIKGVSSRLDGSCNKQASSPGKESFYR